MLCCTPDSPRALPAADLATVVREHGGTARVVPVVADAVRMALDESSIEDAVVVTGSLYTVGAARAACRRLGLMSEH